jgi:hypothetical protein
MNNLLLVIDSAPYISKYLREEIEFERENDSFFPVASVSRSQIDSLKELVEQVRSTSFKFDSIVFDVSDLISWNFMDRYPVFLGEEKFEEYLIQNLAGFGKYGVDTLGEEYSILLENPPEDLLRGQSFVPLFKEPESENNVDLDPPAWVVQKVEFIVYASANECRFVWHIWERTMSMHISDGERYFMLESYAIALDSLLK